MSIVQHDNWDFSERGKKDAERHHKKIDESIRKNVRDVIAEDSIITKKRGRKVRVKVKGMKDYRYIYGDDEEGNSGAGQGDTKPGDTIGKKQKPQKGKPGEAGDQPGEDIIEAEVDIDYLIKIMFEDLGLPWIEEKTKVHQLVSKGWKFESITKKAPMSRIHKKKTLLEAIKRNTIFVGSIIQETGCSEEDAQIALNQSFSNLPEAIKIIKEGTIDRNIKPNINIIDDDLRFKLIEHDLQPHSKAVVIAMMDVSGSMTMEKKYLARSMLFWMVEFLKKVYESVEIKFITHTTEANVVDEDTFFHKMESGGTKCSTAFDKCCYLIDTEFPTNEWNVYSIYLSDGEDWDISKTILSIKKLLQKSIQMLGYCEIHVDEGWGGSGELLNKIKGEWTFSRSRDEGTDFYKNEKERFLACVIENKKHIFPALKHFFFDKKGRTNR